jgi:dienelactone hydrolase
MTQVVFLAFLAGFAAVHAESVDFTITPENGKPIVLPGELEKPVGEGPFPAIVMLHGCAGPWPLRDEMWSRRMVDWGYVVLIQSVDPSARAEDAHAAKQYLQKLTFIDGSKIGVMGMSHGGWATLLAVQKGTNESRSDTKGVS